ncbi:hypothetical protein [Streptomyces sp. NPDC059828]|uniref:hypothetical protein n=1 Tax=Streptomyces sp. NPDC059828 TaxID=3346965 RepID=UPI0036481329
MTSDDKRPRSPAEFRELLREVYEPPEVEEEGKRRHRRRARRQARRDAKQNRKSTVKQVLEEERAKEPMNPAGAAVIIVVILVVGFGATKWILGDEKSQDTVSVAPSSTAAGPAAGSSTTPSATPSVSASPSASVPPVDLSSPEKTAEGWARVYMTRNPPVDKEHESVVERAAPWMTEALARNLAGNEDSLWNNLISNGGVSTVTTVDVSKADEKLGIDTPLRAWREVTVKTAIEGYKKYDKTYVFQAEMTRDDDEWRVSRVLGV